MSTLNTYNLKSPDSANTNIELDASGNIAVRAGSAASPSIYVTGDTNTGIYSPGADQVAISTGGSGRLFVDASGNVGIGNNAPLLAAGYTSLRLNGSTGGLLELTSAATRVLQIQSFGAAGGAQITTIDNGSSPPLIFGTNSAERLRITSAGLVGVGTSSPSTTLHVVGTGLFTGSTQFNNGIQLRAATQNYIYFDDALSLTRNGVGDRVSIDSSGRVGIGTTSPSSTLTVNGKTTLIGSEDNQLEWNLGGQSWRANVASGGLWYLYDGTNTKFPFDVYTNSTCKIGINPLHLEFRTANSERARIDSSGRLLVGTSSTSSVGGANAQLQSEIIDSTHVRNISAVRNGGTIAAAGPTFTFGRSRGTSLGSLTSVASGDNLGYLRWAGADGSSLDSIAAQIVAEVDGTPGANDMPGRLVFSTTADGASSPTERMRIANDGVVSISNGRLYIQKSDASNPLCYAYNTNNASTDVVYRSELGAGSNGTSAYHFYAVTGGSGKFAIYGNGTYGTISDQRLKTHIETARNGYLDDLNRLNIVKYGWKTDGLDQATELGVIAQEVEQVFPGLIQETPPNEDGEVYKGVKTSVFTFMLIKALQEASAKIETLEAKVAALESA